MKIVEVEWVDSSGWSGWESAASILERVQRKSLLCKSVGYLLREEEDRIAICENQGWHESDPRRDAPDTLDMVMLIPRSAIKSIKVRR